MNQGATQSSPVQQIVTAGNPNWWSINNMRPPPHHQHHSFLAALPDNHFLHQLTPQLIAPPSSWNRPELLPESWSQLLLGGLVVEENKPGLSYMQQQLGGLVVEENKPGLSHRQPRKLENWEQQYLLNQTSNSCGEDVKREISGTSHTYGTGNVDFQAAKSTNSWSSQMVSASSSKSCVTTLSSNMMDFSHKSSECNSTATGGAAKKARIIQTYSAQSTVKVRKEKLGDRITALHQLVSPFGKTDTASVLLEAIRYIRFLQSQIETLSLPYLGSESGNRRRQQPLLNENYIKRKAIFSEQEPDEEPKGVLKRRGLCLVPLSCTVHIGSEINGADFWSPVFSGNFH